MRQDSSKLSPDNLGASTGWPLGYPEPSSSFAFSLVSHGALQPVERPRALQATSPIARLGGAPLRALRGALR